MTSAFYLPSSYADNNKKKINEYCLPWSYNPETYCAPNHEWYSDCMKEYEKSCCSDEGICAQITLTQYLMFSAIGCLVFLVVFIVAFLIYKKKKKAA